MRKYEIVALDGVDRTGKTTIAENLENQYGWLNINAHLFLDVTNCPRMMRVWSDPPIMSVIKKAELTNVVLDRSIISSMSYNHDLPYYEMAYSTLKEFFKWYSLGVFYVWFTFYDVKTIMKRDPGISEEQVAYDNNSFKKVYDDLGVDPLIVYAEDSIGYNLKAILNESL